MSQPTTTKMAEGHELICIKGRGSHSVWRAVHTAGCGLASSGDHRGFRVGHQKCRTEAAAHVCPERVTATQLTASITTRAEILCNALAQMVALYGKAERCERFAAELARPFCGHTEEEWRNRGDSRYHAVLKLSRKLADLATKGA